MLRLTKLGNPSPDEGYQNVQHITFDEDENDNSMDFTSYCSGSVCSRRSALKPSSKKWSGSYNDTRRPLASDERSTRSEVSFNSVGIRQFKMTVGDNPSAMGPPVQLDYTTNQEAETFNIDVFESRRKPRRTGRELRLSTRQRHEILRKEGQLSQQEINDAVLRSREIRKQRLETHSQSSLEQQWDEFTESAQRKLARYCLWCYF